MDSRVDDPLSVLDPSIALDGSLAALVVAALICGLAALLLARWRPERLPAAQLEARPALRLAVELLLPALLLAWGLALVLRIQATANPQGLPMANDLHEYLGFVVHWIDPELGYLPPYRYPLWAWLAARVSTGLGIPPASAAIGVSLVAAAALPLALYALARQLAPPGVAFAGALLACATPPFVQQVGVPNDYMLGALLGVLALAGTLAAVLRGGWWRHLAAGLALALFMASSYRAFTTLTLALGVLALAACWRSWAEHRAQRALELLAALAPMALVWWIYGEHCRAVSLERAVFTVHEHLAAYRRTTIGWEDYPRSGAALAQTGGTWVVGHEGALRGLPTTVAFLLDASEVGTRLSRSWETLLPYLRHALSLRWLPWVALALPAGLAVGAWGRARPLRGARVLAGLLVLAALALGVGPLRSLPQAYRYFLPALILLPCLAACGASALLRPFLPRTRAAPLLGLPVALLALGLAWPSSDQPLARAVDGQRMSGRYLPPEGPGLSTVGGVIAAHNLARSIQPGDQVVDLSHHGLATPFMLGQASLLHRPLFSPNGASWRLDLPAHQGERRFLFDACFGHMRGDMQPAREGLLAALAADPRFERRGRCVVEDRRPDEPWRYLYNPAGPSGPTPAEVP